MINNVAGDMMVLAIPTNYTLEKLETNGQVSLIKKIWSKNQKPCKISMYGQLGQLLQMALGIKCYK